MSGSGFKYIPNTVVRTKQMKSLRLYQPRKFTSRDIKMGEPTLVLANMHVDKTCYALQRCKMPAASACESQNAGALS